MQIQMQTEEVFQFRLWFGENSEEASITNPTNQPFKKKGKSYFNSTQGCFAVQSKNLWTSFLA